MPKIILDSHPSLKLDKQKIIRATRLSLAMLISFVYVKFTDVMQGIWVPMTCAIVLFDNNTVGGTMIKSYYRMLGTFLAMLFSLGIIIGFANNDIANLLGIACSVFLAAYYFMDTEKNYVGGLIAWTTPILLINDNNFHAVFVRPLNIVIGVIISYILLRLFYPQYAKNLVLVELNKMLDMTRKMLDGFIDANITTEELELIHHMQEAELLRNMTKIQRLLAEAKMETKECQNYVVTCQLLFTHLRRLRRFVAVIIYSYNNQEDRMSGKIQQNLYLAINVIKDLQRGLELNLHEYTKLEPSPIELITQNVSLDEINTIHALSIIELINMILQELKMLQPELSNTFEIRKQYALY